MHSRPVLFEPVHYSQKSLITGTVYNSPDELYTFDEDANDDDVPRGVFTVLTKCYTYGCDPEQGGCYAPRCPNKQEVFEAEFLVSSDIAFIFYITNTLSPLVWIKPIPTILYSLHLLSQCKQGKPLVLIGFRQRAVKLTILLICSL